MLSKFKKVLFKIVNIFKIINYHEGKNYSLYSGERQTATNVDNIRKDHIYRYEYALSMIKKYLGDTPSLMGADIFCGNGYGSYILSKEIQNLSNLLSIDGSKQAIKIAKKYYQKSNIEFNQKFFPFKLKKNMFDFIVSLETIEHITDDYFFVDNLTKSLKSNGILILSTPNTIELVREVNINRFHIRHYLFENIVQWMTLKGFSLLEFSGQDTYILDKFKRNIGLKKESEMILRNDYKGQFIIYTFKKS